VAGARGLRHWRHFLDQALREGAWEFARSSGPGGQHVNKTESKAVWRWQVEYSFLTDEEKLFVMQKMAHLLTRAGELMVASERFRDRDMNQKDCIEKVRAVFAKAFYVKPLRRKTKPTYSSQKKRMESKRIHGETKKMRRRPVEE
jgi:ribosome-associated protein